MAFENVDVKRLKSAINSCKSAINYNTSTELINSISSNDVWRTGARDNVKKALKKLTNERYKELEKKLENSLKVANYIEEYKTLQAENKTLQNNINKLEGQLYETKTYTETYTDSNGEKHEIEKTKTEKNYNVQRKINSLEADIRSNNNQMQSLVNKVSNLT